MTDKALQALKATAALTTIAQLCGEVAAIAERLHKLADDITASIDTLAPAVGVTVDAVFDPLLTVGG